MFITACLSSLVDLTDSRSLLDHAIARSIHIFRNILNQIYILKMLQELKLNWKFDIDKDTVLGFYFISNRLGHLSLPANNFGQLFQPSVLVWF